MTKDINKVYGKIQKIKMDKKGLQLDNGIWYSNKFAEEELTFKVGDDVCVEFTINGNFKNYTKVTSSTGLQSPFPAETKKSKYDTGAMYVSYAKDIFVALINKEVLSNLTIDHVKGLRHIAIESIQEMKEKLLQETGDANKE